ncbi:MAG: pantoate--beta-alanine ligase [Elusimicrobia bacterium]|nr:pantoate--beta-alanine ligase [Elusimicrobiota bacterium]
MRTIRGPGAMAAASALWRQRGLSVGFVPTMGALHEGHVSLVRRARAENRRVAVSIFVNPAQFGPQEDYRRYPRTLPADLARCRRAGADAVFCPEAGGVYPEGFSTQVEVRGLSDRLCGRFRPGHFKGVATVVLKLLNIVRPHAAYFGEKDFQQLVVIRRMAADLDLPVRVVGCPIIRESDGLAMSSRNRYLGREERSLAPLLHGALAWGARQPRGATPAVLLAGVRKRILRVPGISIDYVSLVDGRDLTDARARADGQRLLAAVRLGGTRLIDNVEVA